MPSRHHAIICKKKVEQGYTANSKRLVTEGLFHWGFDILGSTLLQIKTKYLSVIYEMLKEHIEEDIFK